MEPVQPREESPPELTCYRHPDRRAGVGCQRCGRPICPSCMVTASVGFQCPECAHAGAKQSKTIDVSRTRGRLTRPLATMVLIALNVAAYLIDTSSPGHTLTQRGGLYGPLVKDGQWYRLLTNGFLHADILHIGFNMYALWIIGNALESAIGRLRFVSVYFVTLFGGSLGVMILERNDLAVGASGAIFGLFGLLLVIEMSQGISPLQSRVAPVIGLNLIITFIPSLHIAIGAHLGGLVVGGAAGAIMYLGTKYPLQTSSERAARLGAVIGLGVGCAVAAVVVAGLG